MGPFPGVPQAGEASRVGRLWDPQETGQRGPQGYNHYQSDDELLREAGALERSEVRKVRLWPPHRRF